MNGIDVLNNSSLYFSATSAAAKKAQKEQEKAKTQKTKNSPFSDMVLKKEEEFSLASAGLPLEIAGLSVDDAINYLKDAVDLTADALGEQTNEKNMAAFRKAVGQFIKYIEKNNYEIKTKKRFGISHKKSVYFEERKPRDPLFQIHIIDKKLDELAAMVLQSHSDKLKLLSKVDEIKGMLVDFLAE